MELVIAIVVSVLVIGGIVWAVRSAGRGTVGRDPSAPPWDEEGGDGHRVVLDLSVEDPTDDAVARLVQSAASQALQRDRTLARVEVADRDGRLLGTVSREARVRPEVELPPELHEPHVRRSRAPDVTRPRTGSSPREVPRDETAPVAERTFSERFELPAAVRAALVDRDHPAELIRALLQAGGHPAERHGELVRTGDLAFVTVSTRGGADEALTRAFLRIRNSGARHGIVVRLGYADPDLVKRRDRAAPDIRFTDVEAIQRMADAVAVGADPVAFALAPRVLSAPAGSRPPRPGP
jgi:hypothetical protein